MRIELNVNADALVQHANKLEKLSKSAFPNAVRGTLNKLAFDVKTNTMPESADRSFVNREKNFFKANSRVETARGFDVNTMAATVGFLSISGSNQAVEDLEAQEHGGTIDGRSFIPVDAARTSSSPQRIVARRNRISGIKNIVHTSKANGKTKGEQFVKSVVHAGKGGHVLHENMLFRVDRLQRAGSGWKFKLTAIHSFKQGRKVRIARATHFMERATEKSAKKADEFYFKEAERQYIRHLQ